MSAEEGLEIGRVREAELDSMLSLMCEAFSLPFPAARRIFYEDPYFDLANKRVLRLHGRIVSCLTIVETSCWVGAAVLKIAGIAGVATLPDERGKGYAGRLLTETVSLVRERGYALSALIPYQFDYYRRFGWETSGYSLRIKIPPSRIPAYADYPPIRPATEEDIPELIRLYNESESGNTLRCLRDTKRWRYLLTYIPHGVVYAPSDTKIEGYLLYDLQRTLPEAASPENRGVEQEPFLTLRLLEMQAVTSQAQRGLLGYLARQGQAGQIEYRSDWRGLAESGLIRPELQAVSGTPVNVEILPSLMLRVADLEKTAASLCPEWSGFQGALLLVMTDPILPTGRAMVLVDGSEPGVPRALEVQSLSDLPEGCSVIEGDVRAWSQVVAGHYGAAEAYSLDLLRPSSSAAVELAAQLFPIRSPFLPMPDHF